MLHCIVGCVMHAIAKFIVPSSSEAGSPSRQLGPEDEGTVSLEDLKPLTQ